MKYFCRSSIVLLLLETMVFSGVSFAKEQEPPSSTEVTVAIRPYFDSYQLAGAICVIADKHGTVPYKLLCCLIDVVDSTGLILIAESNLRQIPGDN